MPGSTLDQQVASGFNRCNATTNEGGVIPEEYQVLYTRDRTETVSQVWMGLTAGCAVCHDHKFDPLSQREFYELSAFFNNTTQPTMDGNVKDTPPTVFVPAAGRSIALANALGGTGGHARAAWKLASSPPGPTSRNGSPRLIPRQSMPWSHSTGLQLAAIDPTASETPQPGKGFESADSGNFEKDHAFSFGAWVKVPKPGLFGSVIARMDDRSNYRGWDMWLEGRRIATHLVHQWPEDALKVVSRGTIFARSMDARARDLRRIGQILRREYLHQRKTAGNRCPCRCLEANDPHPGAAQGGPKAHRVAN